MTVALLAQDRHDRLRHVDDAVEVGIDLGAERVDGGVLERAQVAVAGAVDGHIDATECLHGLSNRAHSRVMIGHVQSQRKHPVAVGVE
jgi:hypothetical protein